MSKIYPVLLAGGSGTRLWPLSRKSYPKQFSKLIGETTLFQSSAQRLTSSDIVEFYSHVTLTNADFRFIIGEQLQELGIDPGPILIEPEAKNTAAAILAASIFAHSSDQDAVLFVASPVLFTTPVVLLAAPPSTILEFSSLTSFLISVADSDII